MHDKPMEIIKTNADEFGGWQVQLLNPVDVEQRMCAAEFCSWPGAMQIEIPLENPPQYRIVCKRHYILIVLMIASAIGDPSPSDEAKRVAAAIGFDWNRIRELEPRYSVTPENFICMNCGGGLLGETSGLFKGKRWVHTCGQ